MASEMPGQLWVGYEWAHRLCTCLEPGNGTTAEGFVGHVCNKCHRSYRWQLIRCPGCTKKYIIGFSHPEWCVHTARCLNCLEGGYQNTCTRENCTHVQNPLPFRDYKYIADRIPRAVPALSDTIDSDFTAFEF